MATRFVLVSDERYCGVLWHGIKKFNFCLILPIRLRSRIFSFFQRNHETSIFAWEKANFSWHSDIYIYIYISLKFWFKVELAQSLKLYSNSSIIMFLCKSYERWVFILTCLIMNVMVMMNLIYKTFHYTFYCKLILKTLYCLVRQERQRGS